MGKAGTRAVALAVALAVVVAAGCGGGGGRLSKSQYEKKLTAEATTLQSAFTGVSLQPGGDMKALAAQVGSLQQKIESSADEIDKLTPPKDAEADNQKIADTLHTFADLFGEIKKAAERNDPKKVRSLVQKVASASQAGADATADLKSKGYQVGSFGG